MTAEEKARRHAAAVDKVEDAKMEVARAHIYLDAAAQALSAVQGAADIYNQVQAAIDSVRALWLRADELTRDPNLLLDHDPAESSR